MSTDIWWLPMDISFLSLTRLPPAYYESRTACADKNRSWFSIQIHAEGVLSSKPLITPMHSCKDSRTKRDKKEKHPTLLEALSLDMKTLPFTCTCMFTYPAPSFTLFTASSAGREEDLVWELLVPGKTAIQLTVKIQNSFKERKSKTTTNVFLISNCIILIWKLLKS